MGTILIYISIVIFLAASSVVVVKQYHLGVVRRFGRYVRQIEPGINFVIPVMDSYKMVEAKNRPLDFEVSVRTPDSSSMTFPVHAMYRTVDVIEEELNENPDKKIKDLLSQIISDFTKDPNNPPKDWDEALQFSRGDKYISRIIAVLKLGDFPRYSADGDLGCDGSQHGDGDSLVEKHDHSETEKKERIKNGAYKMEVCMSRKEKQQKDEVKKYASLLMSGNLSTWSKETSFDSGLKNLEFRLHGTGRVLTQLTIESPKPSKELQEQLDSRNKVSQKIKEAETRAKLEEAERNFEIYNEETQALKMKVISDVTQIPVDEVYFRKIQEAGKASEYRVSISGSPVIEKILNLILGQNNNPTQERSRS